MRLLLLLICVICVCSLSFAKPSGGGSRGGGGGVPKEVKDGCQCSFVVEKEAQAQKLSRGLLKNQGRRGEIQADF